MINDDSTNTNQIDVDDVTTSKIRDICERIEILLDSYCDQNGFEDLQSITAQQYAGGLMFVRFNLFDVDKSLLHKYTQGVSHDHCVTDMYDDDVLCGVCDFYIYLCMRCNKIPKPIDFSYLTGIDLDTLKRWEGLESQRPRAYGLVKRLRKTYETGLENGAQGGKNPVGYIATLNHRFGWSQESKPTLTVNITRSQNEIMSTYNQNLIDDQGATHPETP